MLAICVANQNWRIALISLILLRHKLNLAKVFKRGEPRDLFWKKLHRPQHYGTPNQNFFSPRRWRQLANFRSHHPIVNLCKKFATFEGKGRPQRRETLVSGQTASSCRKKGRKRKFTQAFLQRKGKRTPLKKVEKTIKSFSFCLEKKKYFSYARHIRFFFHGSRTSFKSFRSFNLKIRSRERRKTCWEYQTAISLLLQIPA